ncbi:MAG: exosortase/archaeosortase family protein, partial [Phycisphaerae bacterium]
AVVIDYVMPGMPPDSLKVEEACSGMRSLMAFVTLGVAMAYLGERPTWQRIVMILTCLPIAVLCNTIRVTVTGLLIVTGHPELARGTAHQMLGILMFGIALGLFALVGTVVDHLFVEEPGDETGEPGPA